MKFPQCFKCFVFNQVTGFKTLDEFVSKTIPESIKIKQETRLGRAKSESEMLERIKEVGSMNKVLKSYIGLGYYNTITPPVILRNIMENPGWYTQYTPYQPEIAQGRLESLLNFQTMVCDLTGLDVANASLLDEGTAAGEAMLLCYSSVKKRNVFFVDENIFPQTLAVLQTRAQGFSIEIVTGKAKDFDFQKYKDQLIGVMFQYPNMDGEVIEYEEFAKKAKDVGAYVCCATDLLALTLLKSPGEFGCDIAFGNAQRFGVPLGYGGPHAAFFAVKDSLKRKIPGRLVGLSKDVHGKPAYRLALQTREQHIRREKATSNICTAQALLANMSAMYAVYHGPQGLKNIAQRVHNITAVLATSISAFGHKVLNKTFFDTIRVELAYPADDLMDAAVDRGYNLRKISETVVSLSIDETVTKKDVRELVNLFATSSRLIKFQGGDDVADVISLQTLDHLAAASNISSEQPAAFYPQSLKRSSSYLTHEVFNTYHSETEMLRYLNKLQKKDLSLADAMIPLGSCTMKLNATVEMIPVTMPEFGAIHPFVPKDQAKGYEVLFEELEYSLSEATGFEYISLQPNSGAQGEYTGLRVIRKYLDSIGQGHRDVCLIPVSAHGTNPASAVMCGMRVVTVQCDEKGNLDLTDLKAKLKQHEGKVAATMITYPSTYGVFEESIQEVCNLIHEAGGQVYMDGANLNAQMGLCKPGEIGADVCHLNLHKTFCIPHGGNST
jgi:glycine dehydrogenase